MLDLPVSVLHSCLLEIMSHPSLLLRGHLHRYRRRTHECSSRDLILLDHDVLVLGVLTFILEDKSLDLRLN